MEYKRALIIGAGAGLSASLARRFSAAGMSVALAARSVGDLGDLAAETGATTHVCDAARREEIAALFEAVERDGAPDVLVYNPSARVPGDAHEIDGAAVERAVQITALGAFHAAQEAAKRMIPAGRGAILLTGATAGVKGYARSAAFAMGKFALRGLAQSLARELHPKGIHVGHFVIDGGIRNPARPERVDAPDAPDSMLDPDAIAGEYMNHLAQHRSCWSWEVELRPWVERF
ncbi:MAG: SDR family NAD(P)-dependent oxidoreductase [Pseudomonadota bacterium]